MSALTNNFEAVNEFFLSTEIRFKRLIKNSSFQDRKINRRVTSGKNRELFCIVLALKDALYLIKSAQF